MQLCVVSHTAGVGGKKWGSRRHGRRGGGAGGGGGVLVIASEGCCTEVLCNCPRECSLYSGIPKLGAGSLAGGLGAKDVVGDVEEAGESCVKSSVRLECGTRDKFPVALAFVARCFFKCEAGDGGTAWKIPTRKWVAD